MPCENCNVQFTVFKRKKTCGDCKRFYCSSCLLVSKKNVQIFLCERCTIFSKRPLLHSDLHQLKPKDLIFFLQSKHISTTGCVEKEELIRLVLNHVDQSESSSNSTNFSNGQYQYSTNNSQTDATGNSFDNLRQTCQNFFFNITENISDSLAAFDNKNSGKPQHDNRNVNRNGHRERRTSSNSSSTHIFDQPRVSRREIPTYASSINNACTMSSNITPCSPPTSSNVSTTTILINERSQIPSTSSRTMINRDWVSPSGNNQSSSLSSSTSSSSSSTSTTTTASTSHSMADEQKTSASSSLGSPIVSISSIASQSQAPQEIRETPNMTQQLPCLNLPKLSDCECSDDELIDTYTKRNSLTIKNENDTTTAQKRSEEAERPATQNYQPNSRLGIRELDETSHSSFEELGAVGCSSSFISDDSKATEDSVGSSNADAWQFLEKQSIQTHLPINNTADVDEITAESTQSTVIPTDAMMSFSMPPPPPRKKTLRRRSSRQRSSGDEESLVSTTAALSTAANVPSVDSDLMELELEHVNLRRRSGTCRRCGKNNLRRYVERMRKHLESSQMSEADIKREMHEFLAFLEDQTRSIDYSETETTASPLPNESNMSSSQLTASANVNHRDTASYEEYPNDNDGIHVYAAETSSYFAQHNSRFVNLEEFDSVEDLESLTVKQLKEVLMLHRVDYKGCCEKQELLERVERLWKNLKSTPAVEKLPTDELCKICMDAPIECVILECGHCCTCTGCGKVLSECPICRQYIVRVVRFFRA